MKPPEVFSERVRGVLAGDRVASARDWCRRAGISSKALAMFLHRAALGQNPSMRAETAELLARSADVDFEWLITGHGHPYIPRPNREKVIDELVVRHNADRKKFSYLYDGVGLQFESNDDYPTEWWEARVEEHRRKGGIRDKPSPAADVVRKNRSAGAHRPYQAPETREGSLEDITHLRDAIESLSALIDGGRLDPEKIRSVKDVLVDAHNAILARLSL